MIETLDYLEENKKEQINEIKSLVPLFVHWNGKGAFSMSYPSGSKVYNGTPEGFAKFLRSIGASEASTMPRSDRTLSYKAIVDNITSGKDPNIWAWSHRLNSVPRINNEQMEELKVETLHYI